MQTLRRRIKWALKTRTISQVPTEGLEFALVSSDYEQVHQFVWCKDFMQDAIHGFLNNKRASIYKFVYDPELQPPLHMKKTRLLIANFKDQDFGTKVENCLSFLHQIEDKLKMAHTKAALCKDPPRMYKKSGVYLLNGSKRWMQSAPMISLYTLLIRIGMTHQKKCKWETTIENIINGETYPYYNEEDPYLLGEAKQGLDYILQIGDRRIFYRDIAKNYPKKLRTATMHEDCGIVSFAEGKTREDFSHWHRFER